MTLKPRVHNPARQLQKNLCAGCSGALLTGLILMTTSETFVKRILSVTVCRRIWQGVAPILFYGNDRCCAVCGRRFRRFVPRRGREHRCPVCFSEPRHRIAIRCPQTHTSVLTAEAPLRVLHVAPELCMMDHFLSRPNIEYVSIDLFSPLAQEKMDLRALRFPDGLFDFIYCSHVLEHIREDGQAMRELHRVLKPGGQALLMVPIRSGPTLEDPAVTSPQERLRLYLHPDHVRCYGDDFQERLEAVGFQAERHVVAGDMPEAERRLQGVNNEPLFLCTRP